MARPSMTKSDETLGRYAVFAITFGVIFCVFYLFVMNYSWQLFSYYPATNQWVLYGHAPAGASPGPAMKWYGYVATTAVVAAILGLVASLIPEQMLRRFWWRGLIWAVPILTTIVLFYLIVYVGD